MKKLEVPAHRRALSLQVMLFLLWLVLAAPIQNRLLLTNAALTYQSLNSYRDLELHCSLSVTTALCCNGSTASRRRGEDGRSLTHDRIHCRTRTRYNIYNKRILNILPMPWLMASAQLGIGLLYVFPLWLTKLRKAPKLAKGSLAPLRYVSWYSYESIHVSWGTAQIFYSPKATTPLLWSWIQLTPRMCFYFESVRIPPGSLVCIAGAGSCVPFGERGSCVGGWMVLVVLPLGAQHEFCLLFVLNKTCFHQRRVHLATVLMVTAQTSVKKVSRKLGINSTSSAAVRKEASQHNVDRC